MIDTTGPFKDVTFPTPMQMVYRQAEDLVFDDHVFRSRLGYRPRPFRPTRADFSIPRELLRYRLPG